MLKILITGATGFVGSYILRKLTAQGHAITAIKRSNSPMDLVKDLKDKVTWINQDLTEIDLIEEAFIELDLVIHCAAIISFDPKKNKLRQAVNLEATKSLLDLSLKYQVNKFIFLSSVAAIDNNEKFALNESLDFFSGNTESHYGHTKYLAEKEVWRAAAEGLDVCILSPSVVLGAGYWHQGSPKMIKYLSKGSRYFPSGRTGFVDVRDIAHVVHEIIDQDCFNEKFILSGANLSYQELYIEMAKIFKTPNPQKALPKAFYPLILLGDKLRTLFTGKARSIFKPILIASQKKTRYSSKKVSNRLSFSFTDIKLTIAESCQAYLNSKKAKKSYGILPFN